MRLELGGNVVAHFDLVFAKESEEPEVTGVSGALPI